MEPTVVFCTTCKGRAQHLKQTLPMNLVDNESYPKAKFVILDYDSRDDLANYLSVCQRGAIDSGKLAVYKFPIPTGFKMAHAKNLAHRLGLLEGADVLVNLDADNFTGRHFAGYVADNFSRANGGIFLWANRNQPVEVRFPKGCSGRIIESPAAFLKAGGYDEAKYNTWGPDDKDFNFRLKRLGYAPREIDRKYLDVVLHNDKMRFGEYPHVQAEIEQDFEGFQQVDENATIANFGQFGRGVVFKNFGADPIEMGPLPTRIFGIGMHKTGTTSLHHALQVLGYDSGHWPSAHWAKAIWEEMQHGRSLTVEKSYALCDLPITLLYEQLDKAYPGSKFILTTRKENRWLNSVRAHWDPAYNPFREQWDTDPFTHKVHTLLYGRRKFDDKVMLARFRRHNAEVLEYFKNRPDDLLVMDMDAGAGWPQLCGFLKQSIPGVPYPVQFVTAK
jgi:hypothetical protein